MSATGLNLPTVAQIDFGHAGVLEKRALPLQVMAAPGKAVEILDGIEFPAI